MIEEIQDIEKAKKKQDKAERADYQQLLADIRYTFNTSQGKRILYYILSTCGIFSDTATDVNGVLVEKGRRAIGLELLDLVVEADREIYISLIRENLNVG